MNRQNICTNLSCWTDRVAKRNRTTDFTGELTLSTDTPRKQMRVTEVLLYFDTQIEVQLEEITPPMTLKFLLEAATGTTLTGVGRQFFGDYARSSGPTRGTMTEKARASDEDHCDARFEEDRQG